MTVIRTAVISAVAIALLAVTGAQASAAPAVRDIGRARSESGAVITVSPTSRLAADGAVVRVKGRGFDPRVGIYVALCVTPQPGVMPSPCGGGVNMDASDPSSAWISSNPPPYGRALARPYGRAGTFSVRLRVSAKIGDIDCRTVSCSIVTRADHTRLGERRFDAAVPVSFR